MPPTIDPGGAARRPRLAILGAGPIVSRPPWPPPMPACRSTLYEAGPAVATNVRAWGHVRLFTPWEMDVSPRMRRHLEAAGEPAPGATAVGAMAAGAAAANGAACPTGNDLADQLYDRVAALPAIAPRLRLATRVLAVGREGLV